MFSKKGKITAIIVLLLAVAGMLLLVKSGITVKEIADTEESTDEQAFSNDKNTIRLWYTDDALTDYLNSAAVAYNAENEDIRVVPELVSGMEYLENISKASVEMEDMPDLYITTNDTLEKAHLAGLADAIEMPEGRELNMYFGQTAVDAVTYKGEQVGYPLYFECSALLYNNTYLKDWARSTLEAEVRSQIAEAQTEESTGDSTASASSDTADSKTTDSDTGTADSGESSEDTQSDEDKLAEEVAAQVSDEDVQNKIDEYFPSTIDSLLSFADAYDAPEDVDTIFKWAVTDIFYNYFFIGDSIDVGGVYGDDADVIDIYNEAAIRGLQSYQDLNQFFSISTDDVSYDGVIQDFCDGSIVMTIATTDAVSTLKAAADSGDVDFEYAFAALPDISEDVQARSMSVTDVIAVNGYSENKDAANAFAAYLCTQDGREMYERAGKVSALSDADYGDADEYLTVFKSEYDRSVSMPKLMETSNFWAELEMLFSSVWDGSDANAGLKSLSEQMKLQVTGEEYTEEPIVIEEETEEEDEIIETDTLDEVPE